MKHNTDTFWTSTIGSITSLAAYLLGGIDQLIIAFIILVACDYSLGVTAAYYDKKLSSKIGFKGLMKKGAMFVLIIVANQLDIISGSGDVARNAVILFLIGNEGISIVENLGRMGVGVPAQLSQAFSQLKDKHTSKEEKGDKSA